MSAPSALQAPAPELVLASASAARIAMLQAAGLDFRAVPSGIDETAARAALGMNGAQPDPSDVAVILARAKAETVSAASPAAIVIGSDQVLEFEGAILSKPGSMEEARAALLRLKGGAHRLHSAVCIARAGDTIWSHLDTAELAMRAFTPEFVGRYLAQAGDRVLASVGAYQIEGLGAHLFARVEGDHFTIQGLPLLPLLERLRSEGVLLS